MNCCYQMSVGKVRPPSFPEKKPCPFLATRMINGKPYCNQHAPSKKRRPLTIEPLRTPNPQEAISYV